jgi:tagatose bisphosphate family class II aldolase
MLVSTKELLEQAKEGCYAVAAFNIHNLETLQGVMNAAQEERSPVIIQTTPGTLIFAGVKYIAAIVRVAAEEYGVPTALHLDHCENVDLIGECIAAGYTSVMIDASKLPFEENIKLVKEVVAFAHQRGVAVEAELGRIGGTEDDLTIGEYEASLTDSDKAAEYVKRTGMDSLAIAIGTAHGMYRGTPRIDYERLQLIRSKVVIPLVLHGASDVPDEMIKRAVAFGINKINIATDLKNAFGDALIEYFEKEPEERDPRKYFKPAKAAVKKVAKEKIFLAGCNGKA